MNEAAMATVDSGGTALRYECKVCWHVYDPAEGDCVWQIPAGTPFDALPEHWSCPNCSTPKADFLLVDDEG